MRVSQYVNSIVGKRGNIGARTAHVLNKLCDSNVDVECICRGAEVRLPDVRYRSMGIFGHIPRALYAVRIYLLPQYNHRFLDIKLFEHHSMRQLKRSKFEAEVSHVWDCCPNLMRALKAKGQKLVLDVPMAPSSYSRRARDQYPEVREVLSFDPAFLDIERQSFDLADILIAPSDFVAGELRAIGVEPNKIRVIEFGVSLSSVSLQAAAVSKRSGSQGVRFCFLGAVNARKGMATLLEAWADPAFENDELHLCGRVFPAIRKMIANKGFRNVVLPGFVEPYSYLPKCDVFVFPSWLEGSSKAIYEAMACGLPVIATHSSGAVIRDSIDGFLISAGDVLALRERMVWIKANLSTSLAVGEAARNRVQEFTWEKYAERVLSIYQELYECA